MKVGIFNNTSIRRHHYGCVCTCNELVKVIGKFADIEFFASSGDQLAYDSIKDVDAVLINGEGTFHSDRYSSLLLYHILYRAKFYGKKCYLVNTTIQNIPPYWHLEDFDYIFVREPYSLKEAQRYTDNVRLVLDTAFLFKPKVVNVKKDLIGVIDHVDDVTSGQLMKIADTNKHQYYSMISENITEEKLNKFFQKIKGHNYILSGRYHGVVFAIMLGLPVSGLTSNTWKTEGIMSHFDIEKRATGRVAKLLTIDYNYDNSYDRQAIIDSYGWLLR